MAKKNIPLSELAGLIRKDIEKVNQSREDWVISTVALASDLYAARTHPELQGYPYNQNFSQWLKQNDLEFNDDDRRALLKFGKHPDFWRPILETSERTSFQHIYRDYSEAYAAYVRQLTKIEPEETPDTQPVENTEETQEGTTGDFVEASENQNGNIEVEDIPPPEPEPVKGRPKAWTPELTELLKARYLANPKFKRNKFAQEVGFSPSKIGEVLKEIKAALEAEQEIIQEYEVDPATLSKSAQKKIEIAIRQARKQIREECITEAREEARKVWDEFYLKQYNQHVAEADAIINARKGILDRKDFGKIVYCLSIDHRPTDEQKTEALQILLNIKKLLVKEESEKPKIPESFAEMMRDRSRYGVG